MVTIYFFLIFYRLSIMVFSTSFFYLLHSSFRLIVCFRSFHLLYYVSLPSMKQAILKLKLSAVRDYSQCYSYSTISILRTSYIYIRKYYFGIQFTYYIVGLLDSLCVKSRYKDEQINYPAWPIVTCISRVNAVTVVCIRKLHFSMSKCVVLQLPSATGSSLDKSFFSVLQLRNFLTGVPSFFKLVFFSRVCGH